VTSLDLTDPARPADRRLLDRVKWSVVVPWLVSGLLFGLSGYHRFLSVEWERQVDARTLGELRQEIAAQNRQIAQMQSDMAVMRAILERVERTQNGPADTGRRPRQFDH
jgi:cell division protein FtsB